MINGNTCCGSEIELTRTRDPEIVEINQVHIGWSVLTESTNLSLLTRKSPCLTPGSTFVTLRPGKRTLSAADSGPMPRKAKSDFLSVVLKFLASVLGAYSSCSIAFITFRRVFSDRGPFRLITRETIHLMLYEKV